MTDRALLPHIRALDGVRGAAIIAVLFFHADMLSGGFLGVDLFFVLSGFLITSLLLSESARTRHVNVLAFWARRARRLLPALFLVLIGVGLYAAFVADPVELQRIRGDALTTIAYVANWRYVLSGFDYFALFRAPSPLNHTWSLAIEEQFYLIWPLVFAGILAVGGRGLRARARKTGRDREWIARTIFVVCVVLAACSALLMIILWARTGNENRVYYGTDTRAASILIGAALASLIAWRGPVKSDRARVLLEIAGIVAIGILAAAWVQLAGARLYQGGLLICGLAAAVVIAAAAHPKKGVVARVLSIRPLVWLGLISYGVYLWHWPVYVWLSPQRVDLSRWPLLGLRLAVTFAIAIASYVWVEMPIRRGAFSPATLRWLTPAAAALLIAVTLVSTRDYISPLVAVGNVKKNAAAAARVSEDEPGSRKVMIVGNSVAYYLAGEGFSRVQVKPPVVSLNAAQVACNFPTASEVRFGDSPSTQPGIDCHRSWREVVELFRPDVVLLTMGDAGNIQYRHDGQWLRPCDPAYAAFHTDAIDKARADLTARGARLVLTTSAYSRIAINDAATREETDCVNAINRGYAAAHPKVGLVDLRNFVCPTWETCRTEINGVEMRPDGVHYREGSAIAVARWIIPQLGFPPSQAASASG